MTKFELGNWFFSVFRFSRKIIMWGNYLKKSVFSAVLLGNWGKSRISKKKWSRPGIREIGCFFFAFAGELGQIELFEKWRFFGKLSGELGGIITFFKKKWNFKISFSNLGARIPRKKKNTKKKVPLGRIREKKWEISHLSGELGQIAIRFFVFFFPVSCEKSVPREKMENSWQLHPISLFSIFVDVQHTLIAKVGKSASNFLKRAGRILRSLAQTSRSAMFSNSPRKIAVRSHIIPPPVRPWSEMRFL